MKRLIVVAGIALLVAALAGPVDAQQSAPPKDPHHPDAPAVSAPATPPAQPGSGHAGGMMPMEMCRQMMGRQMMGGPMMGGMMGMPMGGDTSKMDPKAMAQMMEMRGEMMKAMGEIMLKHAKKIQGAPR
jgi:hypothetical protein